MRKIMQDILGISTVTPIFFWIWQSNESNETIENATQLKRYCEIRDGGHKTGSNDILACRQVSKTS